MRNTKQRTAILQILNNTEAHLTANVIFAEVRKMLPRISLGTVYRLLDTLVSEGLVCRVIVEGGPSRYEHMRRPHPHVICRACGQIADAPSVDLAQVLARIEQATGYSVSSFQLDGYGLCPGCRATAIDTNAQGASEGILKA